MEPEGSLPHSQVPTTCPYPEPVRSSQCPHIPLPAGPPYIILPSSPGSSKWSLSPQISLPKPCVHLSSPPYVLHAPPISLHYIVYKLKCNDRCKFCHVCILMCVKYIIKVKMQINKICIGHFSLVLQTRFRDHVTYRRSNSPMDDISFV